MSQQWHTIYRLDPLLWRRWDYSSLALDAHDVDVWAFSHQQDEAIARNLQGYLSEAETTRAEKFYTTELQNRYIVRYGILRKILSLYLGQDAKSIKFELGAYGKPQIPDAEYYFNVSHSHEIVVVAITKNRLIGIDVEYAKPISDMRLIAEQYFSSNEQNTLFALPENEQLPAFYRCWTRKESYIKSDGRGLQVPLDSFEVTLAPHVPAQLARIDADECVASQWTLHDLPLPETYIGVVLVSGMVDKLGFWCVNPRMLI